MSEIEQFAKDYLDEILANYVYAFCCGLILGLNRFYLNREMINCYI